MTVNFRALILAFLLSLLSIPAAMAVGGPCLDYYNCERPEDTFRPPPFQDPFPYPMQEEEPPEEEPPEEEEEEEMCSESSSEQTAVVSYLAGAAALVAGGLGGGPAFWIAAGLYLVSSGISTYCEVTD